MNPWAQTAALKHPNPGRRWRAEGAKVGPSVVGANGGQVDHAEVAIHREGDAYEHTHGLDGL